MQLCYALPGMRASEWWCRVRKREAVVAGGGVCWCAVVVILELLVGYEVSQSG